VLYRQTRLGEGGKTFEMLKFRTMVDGAEEGGAARWAEVHDPRVTAFGGLLRRTRMDEVPQLWNVLRGEMSIIGPRPERPEFLTLLEAEVPFWTRRHLVKPGITGWAQVRTGYASDVVGTVEKLSYDLFYIKHRSLLLDLAIALMTVRTVVSGDGAQ
jgi:lipopolysaccharide/colanic/teichoic acid biosynthesis glycosyltransferase